MLQDYRNLAINQTLKFKIWYDKSLFAMDETHDWVIFLIVDGTTPFLTPFFFTSLFSMQQMSPLDVYWPDTFFLLCQVVFTMKIFFCDCDISLILLFWIKSRKFFKFLRSVAKLLLLYTNELSIYTLQYLSDKMRNFFMISVFLKIQTFWSTNNHHFKVILWGICLSSFK